MPDESPSVTLSDDVAVASTGAMVPETQAAVAQTASPAPEVVTPPEEPRIPRCPWCSAELPVGAEVRCPSCSANLAAPGDTIIPGVTAVIGNAGRPIPTEPARRHRLLSWISGDLDVETDPPPTADEPPAEAFAPPPLDVRREMLRIELEGEGLELPDEETAQIDEPAVAVVVPRPGAAGAPVAKGAATDDAAAIADAGSAGSARVDDSTLQKAG